MQRDLIVVHIINQCVVVCTFVEQRYEKTSAGESDGENEAVFRRHYLSALNERTALSIEQSTNITDSIAALWR